MTDQMPGSPAATSMLVSGTAEPGEGVLGQRGAAWLALHPREVWLSGDDRAVNLPLNRWTTAAQGDEQDIALAPNLPAPTQGLLADPGNRPSGLPTRISADRPGSRASEAAR